MSTREIQTVSVLGAGTMGTGIAAACAEIGCKTILLDLNTELADKAKERMLMGRFPMLSDPANADLVTTGSFDDSLGLAGQSDWICEAVTENLEVKRQVFSDLDDVRRSGSIVTTNTSGIPLRSISEGMSEQFRSDVAVTHFFNPVKVMRLLEVVPGEDTSSEVIDALVAFCRNRLGKGVVYAKDTVNFIGNRIGCFWMLTGLHKGRQARLDGVTIERMDALMSVAFGTPSTGLYGLIDLVGLDVMSLVAQNLSENLPADDAGMDYAQLPAEEQQMLENGQLGRKSGGGFYRMLKNEDGTRTKERFDPESGSWHIAARSNIEGDARSLTEVEGAEGDFVWNMLSGTLCYAADLVPEISNDIVNIDRAMRWGFNWKQGPFEILDGLGPKEVVNRLKSEGRSVPKMLDILMASGAQSFYDVDANLYLGIDGNFHEVPEE